MMLRKCSIKQLWEVVGPPFLNHSLESSRYQSSLKISTVYAYGVGESPPLLKVKPLHYVRGGKV